MKGKRTYLAFIDAKDKNIQTGLELDILISKLLGFYPLSCSSGITIQTEKGVEDIHPAGICEFTNDLQKIMQVDAVNYYKIGALCSTDQVNLLTNTLSRNPKRKIIVDPVFSPTKGKVFLTEAALPAFGNLLQNVDFVTPNLPELALLTGKEIIAFETAITAGKELSQKTGVTVLLTGGHFQMDNIREAIITQNEVTVFRFLRRKWKYTHGTGCVFSTFFTCSLAMGNDPVEAFTNTSNFVRDYFDAYNAKNYPEDQ